MKIVTSIAALMIGLTVFGEVLVKSVDPGATVEIDSPIVADDGVRFVNSFERGEVRTISDVFPQRTQKTLLEGANLSEWRVKSGHIQGFGYVDDDALPFNVVRRDGEMDVQLQSRSGLFLRGLKIRLVQNGDDIDIVYVYSRFMRTDMTLLNVKVGVNFDAVPLSGDGVPGMVAVDCDLKYGLENPPTDGNGLAFGLSSLTLEKIGAEGAFHVTAPITLGAAMTVDDNVKVVLASEGALGAEGSRTNDSAFAVGGTLALGGSDMSVTLSGAMTDAVVASETFEGEEWTATLSTVNPTAVIRNAKLGQLKGFRDIDISGSTTAGVFHVVSDGLTATMQFQGFFPGGQGFVGCCFLTMEQQGEDVSVTMTKAVYIWDKVASVDKSKYFGADFNKLTPSDKWRYNVTSATMVMERAKVAPQMPAGASGGQISFGGREKQPDIAVPLPGRLKENNVYVTRTLENVHLCMLKGFTDINTSGSETAAVFYVDHKCDALTMQVHGFFPGSQGYTACCYVEMNQYGNDVQVKQTKAVYIYDKGVSSVDKSHYFGVDFDTLEPLTTPWNYDVKFMTSVFAEPYQIAFGKLQLNEPVIVRGMRLEDLRGFSGLNLSNNDITKNGAFFFANNGQEATVQMQSRFDQGAAFTGCCYVRLRQIGADIEMTMIKSCFIYDSNAPSGKSYYGKDFDLLDEGKAGSWQYFPSKGCLLFDGERILATSIGANEMTGASLVVQTNATATVEAGGNLPFNGTVEVESGGVLALDADHVADKGQTIVVRRGGLLAQGPYQSALDPQLTYLLFDGGEMVLSEQKSFQYADNSGAYVNYWTFANGGRVSGGFKPMLLGYSDGYITVVGSEPANWDCGGLLVGKGNAGDWTLYVTVEDVTKNDAPDFVSTGAFREFGPVGERNVGQRACIRKRGSGTWRMDEASPLLSSTVFVEGGVLSLNANNVMPLAGVDDGGVRLAGGTLELSAGTSNEMVGLTLEKTSTIKVGEGATLVFGDSAENVWADGATLNFAGAVNDHSVRFGTSKQGLTLAQRKMLRFNGERMVLDENGYLVKPHGIILVVR